MHVLVEGNIGAGKTTLINFLKKLNPKDIISFSEPVDRWRSAHGVNLFDLMYKDSKRWTFAFQCFTNFTRLSLHEKVDEVFFDAKVKIVERSLFSAQYCFVENSHSMKLISDVEYGILREWFNFMSKNIKIDYVIYLRSDPKTCLNRINLRSRPEEKDTISLEYLENIHKFHEKWLIEEEGKLKREKIDNVIVIDSSKDLDDLNDCYFDLYKKLLMKN